MSNPWHLALCQSRLGLTTTGTNTSYVKYSFYGTGPCKGDMEDMLLLCINITGVIQGRAWAHTAWHQCCLQTAMGTLFLDFFKGFTRRNHHQTFQTLMLCRFPNQRMPLVSNLHSIRLVTQLYFIHSDSQKFPTLISQYLPNSCTSWSIINCILSGSVANRYTTRCIMSWYRVLLT